MSESAKASTLKTGTSSVKGLNPSAVAFYLGTFLSSMGSMCFNICLVAFMLQSGFELVHVSLILGLQRFIPTIIMGGLGHVTDRLNPRLTVIFLEIGAAASSFGLLYLWDGAQTNYPLFLVLCVCRSILVNFQTGSKGRIAKSLADSSYGSNATHAILNMASSQGATLFSGIVGIVLIKFFSMKTAIILDLLTFLLNGVLLLQVSFSNEAVVNNSDSISWKQKFSDLFKFNPQAAVLDILLALSICGLVSFTARVAGDDRVWNAVFQATYGLSVWVAGYFEKTFAKKFSSTPFWIVLALSFVAIGTFNTPNLYVLALVFVKDLSYWIILHRISGYIQTDTPHKHMGAVSSARFSLMVVVLSIGEILVGAWTPYISLRFETIVRALITCLVGIYLLRKSVGVKGATNERPAL